MKDLMNQDPPTHWDLFLSCDVVVEYISIKNVMDYFFIVKVVVVWSNVPYHCPMTSQ